MKLTKKILDFINSDVEPHRGTFNPDIAQSGDVLLLSGRTRISSVIKRFTKSTWSHCILYIGDLDKLQNKVLKRKIKHLTDARKELVFEGIIGKGFFIRSVDVYKQDLVRVCRADLSQTEREDIIHYCVNQAKVVYNTWLIVRLFLDYSPIKWLFKLCPSKFINKKIMKYKAKGSEICSTVLGKAFKRIAGITVNADSKKEVIPLDFDLSPHFKIIKETPTKELK